SDIHANLAAFTAVLNRTREDRDRILCLGDLVGYGPDPNECVELAAEVSACVLGGNHDLAAGGVISIGDFSSLAKKSHEWTGTVLSPANKDYLSRLKSRFEYPGTPGPILLSHGGPVDPVWSYVFSEAEAEAAFRELDFARCFFGHTHFPAVFMLPAAGAESGPVFCTGFYGAPDTTVETITQDWRFLLNPGSVGFPRNIEEAPSWEGRFHAIARYALFDTHSGLWQFQGVEYDMGDTLERMVRFGLW
ncbi:MAG: metallophosphoesterase, partial [Spirochaetaceae bacterium]|nr:metallophosphoesterase [Spirochaetaceae bacterium]